jgi:hypothetical protein
VVQTATLTLNSTTSALRINAGGPAYTDSTGRAWAADTSYAGGAAAWVTNAISNTADPTLYQTCRWGGFSYTLSVPNATYNVILKFAEITYSSAGARQFNVAINGTTVLTNFDIYAAAGGAFTALDKSFPVTVTGGQVTILFSYGAADAPMVNAVDIEPSATSIRIDSGGPSYTDPYGVLWSADSNYTGGSTFSTTNPILNTTSPSLYQTCRWGAFTYNFPVANGSYNVILKFAEVSRFSPGARQFNVAINGTTVLADFDIYAAAGGAFIALDKSFPVTATSGQITILFSYGAADAPMVNALDIEPSSPIRINSGGPSYTDPYGILWSADSNYTGGSTFSTTNPILNTTSPALYQTCRWGAFTYNFTVANGSYNVILKFAEVSRFSPGARQFNVAINGATVLADFDIYAQAGGAFLAVDRTFPVTVTSGQISIEFYLGPADAPMVNGIEIDPTM